MHWVAEAADKKQLETKVGFVPHSGRPRRPINDPDNSALRQFGVGLNFMLWLYAPKKPFSRAKVVAFVHQLRAESAAMIVDEDAD